MGFYGSKDPTNSVKALNENSVIRIGFQSHRVHPTILQWYNTRAVWKKKQNTQT